MYPNDRSYSEEHEWVRREGDDTCVLGITEFAEQELGDVVFVELPEVGQVFNAHEEIGTIESVKAVAEVYTPVSGEVTAVNDAVSEEPELINREPHGNGWLIRLKMSNPSELDELMDAETYAAFVAAEAG